MIARTRSLFRFPGSRREATRRTRAVRRTAARRAIAWAVLGLALATTGLAAAIEGEKPEWRDPEFGHRLQQIRKWQRQHPDRPLILVFGSSRAQMGVSPAAMELPDGPTDPLVYNFGYRGSQQVWIWLNLQRVLDSGIRPRSVLIYLAMAETVNKHPAEVQLSDWERRLSLADIRRLRPYTEDPTGFVRTWMTARLGAWSHYSEGMRSDLLPEWQPAPVRRAYSWEQMDRFGFVPYPAEEVTPARREQLLQAAARTHHRAISGQPPSELSRQIARDMVERCQREGIAVGFMWAANSPRYRELFGTTGPKTIEDYSRFLSRELGAVVIPRPDHFEEEDFADGYHLLESGAQKYSRWLADTPAALD